MSGSRARVVALGLILAGGLVALLAGGQTWWRLVVSTPGQSVDPATGVITGTTGSGGLTQVLPACLLIAGLLTLVLRSAPGRRVIAGFAGMLGLGTAVLGGWHPAPDAGVVAATLRQSSLADTASLAVTVWPWFYLVGGLLAAAGAALVLRTAKRWPRRADRYVVGPAPTPQPATDAAPVATGTATGPATDSTTGPAQPRDADDPDTWWKAMDAGRDPTEVDDPISAPGGADGTMSADQQQESDNTGSGSDR